MNVAPVLTAVIWVGAALLVYAGVLKIGVPDGAMAGLHSLGLPSGRVAARALGAGEILTGLLIIGMGGIRGAVLASLVYAVLTGIALRQRRNQVDCGCFGVKTYPISRLHIGVNSTIPVAGVFATAAALWTATSPPSFGDVLSDAGTMTGLAGLLLLASAVGLVTTLTERAGVAEARMLVQR